MKVFKRELKRPKSSFFLFGPRGTGKTTWLRSHIEPALNVNLLKASQFMEYETNPSLLAKQVEALPEGSWVVIDEIQKLPELLDEVQDLISRFEDTISFCLTGSSARKLRSHHSNLLAGRAWTREMFPINSAEMDFDFDIDLILRFGTLPKVLRLPDLNEKKEFLSSYVRTYLKEEIQQEALVRNLSKYSRFLKHAAMMNAQVLNLSEVSREVGVKRSTLDSYFRILKETLITFEVPASLLKAKVKEVAQPKQYFFDPGVVRALLSKLNDPLDEGSGYLFETFILNEIRSAFGYQGETIEIEYWGVHNSGEVDFILSVGSKKIALEVKYSAKYKKEWSKSCAELLEKKKVNAAFGVYLGADSVKDRGVHFFPLVKFLKKLHKMELV